MMNEKHKSFMHMAIALAQKGVGRTSPNPMVGAVVVKNDKIVGEGFHEIAGGPHAEIIALRKAGNRAKGADLYVTLEPCCHDGRTPPCINAIIEAGLSKVFIGSRDPNPLVNGKGIRSLKRAGITVVEGLLKKECAALNRVHNKFILHGMPFITAKVALTLDGKIATASGQSKWITNSQCRQFVHELRARSDAVMVGRGTVKKDNPELNVRLRDFEGNPPKAVIVNETLDFSRNARILKRRKGDLICITTKRAPKSKVRWMQDKGHKIIVCRKTANGFVDIRYALKELGKLGISSVLLEGGGALFSSFIQQKLVDRLIVCVAPKLIGGLGLNFLPGISIKSLNRAIQISDVTYRCYGDNIVIEGQIEKG